MDAAERKRQRRRWLFKALRFARRLEWRLEALREPGWLARWDVEGLGQRLARWARGGVSDERG